MPHPSSPHSLASLSSSEDACASDNTSDFFESDDHDMPEPLSVYSPEAVAALLEATTRNDAAEVFSIIDAHHSLLPNEEAYEALPLSHAFHNYNHPDYQLTIAMRAARHLHLELLENMMDKDFQGSQVFLQDRTLLSVLCHAFDQNRVTPDQSNRLESLIFLILQEEILDPTLGGPLVYAIKNRHVALQNLLINIKPTAPDATYQSRKILQITYEGENILHAGATLGPTVFRQIWQWSQNFLTHTEQVELLEEIKATGTFIDTDEYKPAAETPLDILDQHTPRPHTPRLQYLKDRWEDNLRKNQPHQEVMRTIERVYEKDLYRRTLHHQTIQRFSVSHDYVFVTLFAGRVSLAHTLLATKDAKAWEEHQARKEHRRRRHRGQARNLRSLSPTTQPHPPSQEAREPMQLESEEEAMPACTLSPSPSPLLGAHALHKRPRMDLMPIPIFQ